MTIKHFTQVFQVTQDDVLRRFLDAQDRLVLQASDLSLGTISNMVDRSAIDLKPNYQRRERWPASKQAALIESFMLNVPVPPIYLAEDEFGKYSVVDGKQRITAIHRFMMNGLVLSGLDEFPQAEGYRFKDLPIDIQNALEVRPYLRVITLLKQSDPLLKFEVFTRLNRGGEQMQAQELRNVAFRGPLNDTVYALARHPFLRQQLKIRGERSRGYQLMMDAEYVLRFLALNERWRTFSGNYRHEMDSFMIRHRDLPPTELANLASLFQRVMALCEAVWGTAAFKRPAGGGWRDQVLAGMYDAQTVAAARLTPDQEAHARMRATEIREATRVAFNDLEFDAAVRQGTNTPSRVIYRINKVYDLLTANL